MHVLIERTSPLGLFHKQVKICIPLSIIVFTFQMISKGSNVAEKLSTEETTANFSKSLGWTLSTDFDRMRKQFHVIMYNRLKQS